MTAPDEDRMKLLKFTTHYLFAIAVCIFALMSVGLSQTPAPPTGKPPDVKTKIKAPKFPMKGESPPTVDMTDGTTSERAIAVDPKVSLTLCVAEGNVKITGWKRNEIRAFVQDGSRFRFSVLQKSTDGEKPVLVSLVGLRQLSNGSPTTIECIAGEEVELDVPENSAISLKGHETETSVDRVRKASVTNIGGDISVQNVAEGVWATTYRGVVTVENSRGSMQLASSTGNVIAYSVAPADVGDTFKAKTNSGNISLEKLGFRLADVTSISGSLLYSGELLSGGSFNFNTTNGAIRLAIPQNSSCRIIATYGFGNLNSNLPIKVLTDDNHPGPTKTINAVLGRGEATLRLTTSSGSIQIKKLEP
jgi:Putative adhesin